MIELKDMLWECIKMCCSFLFYFFFRLKVHLRSLCAFFAWILYKNQLRLWSVFGGRSLPLNWDWKFLSPEKQNWRQFNWKSIDNLFDRTPTFCYLSKISVGFCCCLFHFKGISLCCSPPSCHEGFLNEEVKTEVFY